MPSLVKIKVERAIDLPIMDTGDASTDAFVSIRLDDQTQQTSTYRKSLNPIWDEEFRFEVADDSILQDEPLEFKVYDQGFSTSELIGVAFIDLNPLIMRTATRGSDSKELVIAGYFPLYDVSYLKGVRGALKISVKLQFIGNDNSFIDASAGVQFFSSSVLSSHAFIIQEILGFVDDLVVEDDPESRWQDYFKKASANESRLKLLYNLASEVRREVGKKALEAGGNAVLGYTFHFDVEGSSGLVVRACGTICRLLEVGNTETICNFSNSIIGSMTKKDMNETLKNGSRSRYYSDIAILEILEENSLLSHHILNNSSRIFSSTNIDSLGSKDPVNSRNDIISSSSRRYSLCMTNDDTRDRDAVSNINNDNLCLIKFVNNQVKSFPLTAFGNESEKTAKENRDMVSGIPLFSSQSPGIDYLQPSAVHLITLKIFPPHVRVRLGGLVMSRSVKFLGKLDASVSLYDILI